MLGQVTYALCVLLDVAFVFGTIVYAANSKLCSSWQVAGDITASAEDAELRAERREKQLERQARHVAVQEASQASGEAFGRGSRTRKVVDYT